MQRIYIAGPDVFLLHAVDVLERKKQLCTKYGFTGITPFDANLDNLKNDYETGLRIARANTRLIDFCSYVIANITPWQSRMHADVGTCVEIGYAHAKGIPVYAYSHAEDGSYFERAKGHLLGNIVKDEEGFHRDGYEGSVVENFGMTDNLMIEGAIVDSGGKLFIVEKPGATFTQRFESIDGFELCLQALQEAV